MRIGIITYDYKHLKTEQVVNNLIFNEGISEIKIFALPFLNRKKREVLFEHRPNQALGTHTSNLKNLAKVSFQKWSGIDHISHLVDFFIITGAGILDVSFAEGKPIVNAHPGIIPTNRGLDSFKWAILNGDDLGITMHFIDKEVDMGTILTIKKTPIFADDTIETVARRHYELEINMLSLVSSFIDSREKSYADDKPAKMRMPFNTEKLMLKNFLNWKMSKCNS